VPRMSDASAMSDAASGARNQRAAVGALTGGPARDDTHAQTAAIAAGVTGWPAQVMATSGQATKLSGLGQQAPAQKAVSGQHATSPDSAGTGAEAGERAPSRSRTVLAGEVSAAAGGSDAVPWQLR
jgi:hypothetical protein